MWKRRDFVRSAALGATATVLWPSCLGQGSKKDYVPGDGARFHLSLAQWSLHRALQSGEMDHLDFAAKAAGYGIFAVEYVNAFFMDRAADESYLASMNTRAADHGVTQLLIMVDGEGGLAEPDEQERRAAVERHHKWVAAAKTLGCHSIRVNAYGTSDDPLALHQAAVDGLGQLATYAQPYNINVIVENHGGYSSNGSWLAGVIKEINLPNCGTLPDFGNFCLRQQRDEAGIDSCAEEYDRYKGVTELMPYAKAVSAKSYDFGPDGRETLIDYAKMMEIVRQSGYSGHIGIEYEGTRLSEEEGIRATKKLLDTLL